MTLKFPQWLQKRLPIALAILAAALYGISAPVAKVLLTKLSPYVMAAFLYLGAGLGMTLIKAVQKARRQAGTVRQEASIPRREWPYVVGMILLDIAAPILLMLGLTQAAAGTAALLNNFEIVVTSILALLLFKEAVGRRMWLAIGLITVATVILSLSPGAELTWSPGALLILLACAAWGLENNCTRMLSLSDPIEIVMIKGFGSGIGALLVTVLTGHWQFDLGYGLMALLLGFVAYGLSIFFYIYAQRDLGAARTSAYYAAAPFIGVLASWIFLREPLTLNFGLGLMVMLVGTYFAVSEDHGHEHIHEALAHDHRHSHGPEELHHDHDHEHTEAERLTLDAKRVHSHPHRHQPQVHKHAHWPDLHHQHIHEQHSHEQHSHE